MRQTIENCFEDAIGKGGLSRAAFEEALAATAPALEKLRAQAADKSLPHLTVPSRGDDLAAITELAARLREEFDDVVVCGTGGSSLGGQALAQTAGWSAPIAASLATRPRLHFCDNLDGRGFAHVLDKVDLERTHFLLISKSGNTAETLSQSIAALAAFAGADLAENIPANFTVITEKNADAKNGLLALARASKIRTLEHVAGLGGRYSALSNVGLLPALVAGLDAAAVRAGAADVVTAMLEAKAPEDCPAAVGAALNVTLAASRNISAIVLMPYSDRLERFSKWFVQLWAESLGKAGKGTTPIAALGPVDQHSQLQLYLDGPNDKLFTIITTRAAGTGPVLDGDLAGIAGADYLKGKRMGDLVDAMQHATVAALAQAGRPVRTFAIESVDARVVGALMMHFMLETIIAAHLLGVDPFDQPAVEAGKTIARKTLARS